MDFDFLDGVESFLFDDASSPFDPNTVKVSLAIKIISAIDQCLDFIIDLLFILLSLI